MTAAGGAFTFHTTRWDLYHGMRLQAEGRRFHRLVPWLAAGLALALGASEGDLRKGVLWAVLAPALFVGLSRLLFLGYAFALGNETLLGPRTLTLLPDLLAVEGEHGADSWPLADLEGTCRKGAYLLVTLRGGDSLVFPLAGFDDPGAVPALERAVLESSHPAPQPPEEGRTP